MFRALVIRVVGEAKWLYGALYLLSVPVFAFLYAYLTPNGFYQSTVVQEGIIKYQEEQLSDWMVKALNAFVINGSGLSAECFDFERKPVGANVRHVTPHFQYSADGKGVTAVSGSASLGADCGDDSFSQMLLFNVNADYMRGHSTVLSIEQFYPYDLDPLKVAAQIDYSEVIVKKDDCLKFQKYFNGLQFENDRCSLVVNVEDSKKFNAIKSEYQRALKGQLAIHEKYWLMLYFSTVTITTLGYGDIVPVTNGARLLVALESILGIVLIGFFLNSVFQSRRNDG